MKRLLTPLLPIIAIGATYATMANGFWENQQIYTSGTEPHVATHFAYPDEQTALNAETSPYFKSLNGDWKFNWVESLDERPKEFYLPSFDDKDWATIPVPSCWESHGYGVPSHRGFEAGNPKIPTIPDYNPTGSYRTTFTLPEGWNERETYINFDGVASAFYLWVNGEMVGYDEDSFTSSVFNITKYLKEGENCLAVEVARWSTGSFLEAGDTWSFGGIFRRVYLESRPDVIIRDFYLSSDLDSDYKDAEFKAKVKVFNNKEEEIQNYRVKIGIYDEDGELISDPDFSTEKVGWKMGRPGTETVFDCSTEIKAPKLWSAEHPNLYKVVLTLVDPDDNVVEATEAAFGFREVEIKDLQVHINGEPVLIKGANRGESDPHSGKTLSEETMIKDIMLMKRHNFNAVRSSHHPNDPRWYALCDKYGIYVMDEAQESSDSGIRGNVLPGSDISWMMPSLDRVVAMVERSKNHPSIIFWSLGNESGWGQNFALMSDYIRRFDPTRPISYDGRETDCWDVKDYFDLNSSMYPFIEDTVGMPHWKSLNFWSTPRYNKPYIMIEYAHAQGNSLGSFCEYWRVVEDNPSFVGGYIWDWVNQTYDVKMEDGRIRQSHRMDYHPVEGVAIDDDFAGKSRPGAGCAKGVIFADRTIKPSMYEVKKAHQNIAITAKGENTYEVRNKYDFTNLNTLYGDWRVLRNGKVVDEGTIPNLDIEPNKSGEFTISAPKMDNDAEYTINFSYKLKEATQWADAGFEVAREEIILREWNTDTNTTPSGKVVLTKDDDKITVSGKRFAVNFDKKSGIINSINSNGREIIAQGSDIAGPELNIYRAAVENDGPYTKAWREAGIRDLSSKLISIDAEQAASGEVKVTTITELGCEGGKINYTAIYNIGSNGVIELQGKMTPDGFEKLETLPRVGIKMALTKGMEQVKWYGRGPHENYPDRNESAFVGLYNSTPSDMFVPYLTPQENGARSDTRWLNLGFSGSKSGAMNITSNEPYTFSTLHYDATDLDRAIRLEYLDNREETILTLDAEMLGVGNASCGPTPLKRYLVPVEEYDFEFTFEL